jgi:hypothetical protein
MIFYRNRFYSIKKDVESEGDWKNWNEYEQPEQACCHKVQKDKNMANSKV